jgi:hypothetical protein
MVPLPSDVGNVWNANERKALRLRRDPIEVDRETTKPPNAKKQRLDTVLVKIREARRG